MGQDVFQVAFYETQQKHAHLTFKTLRVLEKARFAVWRGALKIRVSVVRFRPRPPNKNRCLRKGQRFFLLRQRVSHENAHAVQTLAPRCGTMLDESIHTPPNSPKTACGAAYKSAQYDHSLAVGVGGHGSGMFHLFSRWRILEKKRNIALLDAVMGCHIRRISRGE